MEKKLYRIPNRGTILGICAGVAEYFKIDVTLVRVLAVIAAFATEGAFVVIYFVSALIIPSTEGTPLDTTEDTSAASKTQDNTAWASSNQLQNWAGIGLVALGTWLLLNILLPDIVVFRWDVLWPTILVIVGIAIIFKGNNKNV